MLVHGHLRTFWTLQQLSSGSLASMTMGHFFNRTLCSSGGVSSYLGIDVDDSLLAVWFYMLDIRL